MKVIKAIGLSAIFLLTSCVTKKIDIADDTLQTKAVVVTKIKTISLDKSAISGTLVFKKRMTKQNAFHKDIEVNFTGEPDRGGNFNNHAVQLLDPGIYLLKRIIVNKKENNSILLYNPVWFHVKAGDLVYIGDFCLKIKNKKISDKKDVNYVDVFMSYNKFDAHKIMRKMYPDVKEKLNFRKVFYKNDFNRKLKKINRQHGKLLITSRILHDDAVEDQIIEDTVFGGNNDEGKRIMELRHQEMLLINPKFLASKQIWKCAENKMNSIDSLNKKTSKHKKALLSKSKKCRKIKNKSMRIQKIKNSNLKK